MARRFVQGLLAVVRYLWSLVVKRKRLLLFSLASIALARQPAWLSRGWNFFFLGMFAIFEQLDHFLGRLVGWGIRRTPKAFDWTVERVEVRPSFSSHAWSEVVIVNWTWHNPPGFRNDASSYILQIDRIMLRIELASIYRAVRYGETVRINFALVEGLRLKTERNQEAALNLWEALDLPDGDVNVAVLMRRANAQRRGRRSNELVRPLPPIATEATRKASDYWKPTWGPRRHEAPPAPSSSGCAAPPTDCSCCASCCCCLCSRWCPSRRAGTSSSSRPPRCTEYPIGDPRRRPRWGVPFRFDIEQIVGLQVELWIFDFLTLDQRERLVEPGNTMLAVQTWHLTREMLEAGDERRAGGGDTVDGVRGVYLGELIWVIIAEGFRNILTQSTSRACKNAACAAGMGIRDSTVVVGARLLECALDLNRLIGWGKMPDHGHGMPSGLGPAGGCSVHVHLIMGRGFSKEGQRVNVHARLQLLASTAEAVVGAAPPQHLVEDMAESTLRIWTKTPFWNQHFYLGPVSSVFWTLRVACFHRRTRHATEPHTGTECDRFLGEAFVPLTTLLVRDRVIASDGDIVGWFPLTTGPRGSTERRCGKIKLGLRLVGSEHLPDVPAHLCHSTIQRRRRPLRNFFAGIASCVPSGLPVFRIGNGDNGEGWNWRRPGFKKFAVRVGSQAVKWTRSFRGAAVALGRRSKSPTRLWPSRASWASGWASLRRRLRRMPRDQALCDYSARAN